MSNSTNKTPEQIENERKYRCANIDYHDTSAIELINEIERLLAECKAIQSSFDHSPYNQKKG